MVTYGLLLDPRTGIAGDMLIGALSWILQQKNSEKELGLLVDEFNTLTNEWGFQIQLRKMSEGYLVTTVVCQEEMLFATLKSILHQLGTALGVGSAYLDLAHRSLENLFSAEMHSHKAMYSNDRGEPLVDKDQMKHQLHLHEAHDAIVDMLFTAMLLEKLKVDLQKIFVVKPIPLGRGTITFSHGTLEVPVPAVRYLMKSMGDIFEQGNINTELTTPTGLSILLALTPTPVERSQSDQVGKKLFVGKGYGHKKFSVENALTAYLIEIQSQYSEHFAHVVG